MRILGVVLAAVLLLSGCVSRESGVPAAADKPTSTSSSSSAPAPPEAIDMAGVDVCELLSKLPLQQFGIAGDRPPVGGDSSIIPGAKDCYANDIDANLGLTLAAVTTEGAEDYAANNAEGDTQVFQYELENGFTIWVLQPLQPQDPVGCIGLVDVNTGQLLFINYGTSRPGESPATPDEQERFCTKVQEIAAVAVSALVS